MRTLYSCAALCTISFFTQAPSYAADSANVIATPEQLHILEQMGPAIHPPMGPRHGPSPDQDTPPPPPPCSDEAKSCQIQDPPPPPPPFAKPEPITVSGQLTFVTSKGTQKLTLKDVAHGSPGQPCFWPVGGSVELIEANGTKHLATFAHTCATVVLDGKTVKLPEHPHHGRPHRGPEHEGHPHHPEQAPPPPVEHK